MKTRTNAHAAPALTFLLTLTAPAALAGGLKIPDEAFTALLWAAGLLSVPFWLPPILGLIRLLNPRKQRRSAALGVLSLLSAMLWMWAATLVPVAGLLVVVCGIIGVLLLQSRPPAEPWPGREADVSAASYEQPPAEAVAPPATVLTDRERRVFRVVAWLIVVALLIGGIVASQHKEAARTAAPDLYEGTVEEVLPAPQPTEPIEYATPEEVHAAARRRDSLRQAADGWAPSRSPTQTDGWRP